ncbi:SBBP repeat-containing protein [Caballeronia zhejiangensis]|uniref:NHL domain-containing protein n=1 Tax=Caballeronia zhejiangensis TaxID=871203 RepID=UPI00158A48AD|nr:SBBP repeat-containing protein [Caballeronia zhejiangensis]
MGGAVTGLGSAQQVTLLNNGADALTLTENGTFNFPTPVAYGGNYAVSVGTQPGGETCTVTNGMGTNLSGDVTSVSVACQGPQYTVTTVAGTGAQGSENGQAAAATFSLPSGLRVGTDGTVYVADTANNLIRSISPSGTVATVAGSGINGTASFSEPLDIAVGSNGNLFVADAGNHTIRIINSASGAETGEGASFGRPYGIASDASGNLYVADETNMNIRKISSRGVITTIAGSLASGSADGTGAAAQFNHPTGIAVDTDGTLYVADAGNCEIRKIAAGNVVTTLAGSTSCGFADGTGSAAKFGSPFKIALDTNGDLYVTDGANNSIRKVTRDGVVTTVAGSRVAGATDGLGASASFNNPTGIAIDSFGNIYVADTTNNKIRRLSLHP